MVLRRRPPSSQLKKIWRPRLAKIDYFIEIFDSKHFPQWSPRSIIYSPLELVIDYCFRYRSLLNSSCFCCSADGEEGGDGEDSSQNEKPRRYRNRRMVSGSGGGGYYPRRTSMRPVSIDFCPKLGRDSIIIFVALAGCHYSKFCHPIPTYPSCQFSPYAKLPLMPTYPSCQLTPLPI